MAVYVDAAIFRRKGGRKRYCHMTADLEEELHAFAYLIGVKGCWFERSRKGVAHFDLNEEARARAIAAGAVERRGNP